MRAHRAAPFAARNVMALARRPRLRYVALRDVVAHPERVPPATAYELIMGNAECPMFEPYVEQVENGVVRDSWGDLGVPVRIAWGTRDRTLPMKLCSSWFRDALPDAEWVELSDCGHLPQHDDPQLVARTVLEVSSRSRSSGAA
jgi:pimeloyl-ACP methyl ester carboxylesterase